jgi:ribosome-associated heat shock protein Hsp15
LVRKPGLIADILCDGNVSEKNSSENEEEKARLDLWLWSTRLYKTRSLAAEACRNSRVTVNGQKGKPSRLARIGDRILVDRGSLVQEIEVKAILTKRVGAKLVPEFLVDHTSQEVYEQAAAVRRTNRIAKPKRAEGSGRPTKKERRELDQLMDENEIDLEAFEKFARAIAKKR